MLHAQDQVPGSQSNVTLSLSISSTIESETPSGDNTIFSAKIVKTAYGNKQLIEDMNAVGDLPDETVSGWKLVMVNFAPEDEEAEENSRLFFLVKTGQSPVYVPYLNLDGNYPGSAEAYTETVDGNDTIITGKTTSFRGQFGINGYRPTNGAEFNMSGLITAADKTGPVQIGSETFNYIYQLTKASITGLVGGIQDVEEEVEEEYELIEGSVKLTAEVPIDISNFLN